MECPQCQSPIEADASGEALTACPACGAAIPSATGRRASRGRLMTILLSLVLVAMATISVGSTVVAVRMAKERAIARQNFSDAQETIDKYTTAVLANDKLKGNLESARKEMLKPALDYYQQFVQTNSNDESALRELTAAQFRLAALQAKAGSKSEVPVALNKGIAYLKKLDKTTVDPQTFPSLQNCAMKLVPPAEWVSLQNISPADMIGLTMAVEGAIGTFGALAKEHPQVISFRDDLAGLRRASAMAMSFANQRQQAMSHLLATRDLLETLVRDEPSNADFKNRLIESLVSAARIQKSENQRDEAIANYKRAVELREQLAAAAPDDKSLARDLAAVKRDLERLEKTPPKEAAATAPPAGAQ